MLPITDDHMHINIRTGLGMEAIKDFKRAGGTHVFIVSLPGKESGTVMKTPEDFRAVYDMTVETVKQANNIVKAYGVIGVHPSELVELSDTIGLARAYEICLGGLDLAAKYVAEGKAIALKSGRPNFPVSPDMLEASNKLMRHAMDLSKDLGCAIQLHTETEENTMESISGIALEAGLPAYRVVKHFSPPLVKKCESLNVIPSVIAGKGALEEALSQGTRFMLETDYIDDLTRPGSVLGPKTVPRKTKEAIRKGTPEEVFYRIHKDNPEKSYGVNIEAQDA